MVGLLLSILHQTRHEFIIVRNTTLICFHEHRYSVDIAFNRYSVIKQTYKRYEKEINRFFVLFKK